MGIRTIVKSYYSTQEVELLSQNILSEVSNLKQADPMLVKLRDILSQSLGLLREANSFSRKNTKTQQIYEADQDRDFAFRAFFGHVENGTLRRNKPYRDVCIEIMTHLEKFDRMLYRYGYTKESVELRKLFDELAPVEGLLKKIQANPWLEELKEAEARFVALQREKIQEETDNKPELDTIQAKEVVFEALINLVSTLNIMESLDTEGVAALNAKLDTIIEDMESPAKARNTRRSNSSGDDSEDNDSEADDGDQPDAA